MSLLENVRNSCRKVAEQAEFIKIDLAALESYAAALPQNRLVLPQMDPDIHYLGHGRDTAAYYLTLNAVNFGSGYFPEIFGNSRQSGYRAIAAALHKRFTCQGPIPPDQLRNLTVAECSRIFQFEPANRAMHELTELYTRALNDLGCLVCDRFDGDFFCIVEASAQSVELLAVIMADMPLFRDTGYYRGMEVFFYKRAQLVGADLFIAFGGKGEGQFEDIDRLTICADNLVPHVLWLDGILHYREDLAARIYQGKPLAAGSPEEIEIRACSVHAGELIVAALQRRGESVNAMLLDNFLWHRGQEPFYRAHPRHRTKTAFY